MFSSAMKMLLSAWLALCLATAAVACSCGPIEPLYKCNVQEHPDFLGAALLVKVLSRKECRAHSFGGQAVSKVKVLEVFKDAATDRKKTIKRGDVVEIETNIEGSECGYTLGEGQKHIVFVVRRETDQINSATCLEKPKVRGPCRGRIPRWSYIRGAGKCERFSYGGCSGTANNYDSKEECLNTCHSPSKPCKATLFTSSCAGNVFDPSFVDKVQLAVGCSKDLHPMNPFAVDQILNAI